MDPRDLILAAELDAPRVARLLAGYGFSDPGEADRRLQHITALTGQPELVARLVGALLLSVGASPDPDAALARFESLLERVGSPSTLFLWLLEQPSALPLLSRMLGSSAYLSQILVRNPEYLYWLVDGDRHERVEPATYFRTQTAAAVRPAGGDAAAALDALRRLKRRETLRLGVQELLTEVPLADVVAQVSDLASAIIDRALQAVLVEFDGSCRPAVLAMGKLGGRELNFSSDVDLVYIHPDDADEPAARRVAKALTAALSDPGDAGRLYRVDLRLRPMGSAGEIIYSESATRTYYETWADTTDRLALLKCRPVAGDLELGGRWLESLQDFVYRRYVDQAAIEEIRWIKHRVDRRQRHRSPERDVKLSLGGIREVEFFVQALQLLYGGRHAHLQSPNTLEALARLREAELVDTGDAESLERGYTFLRRLEHRLQLVADQQTHELPADPAELRRLALRMGFEGEAVDVDLSRQLEEHRGRIHEIFLSLFPSRPGRTPLQRLLLGQSISEEAVIADLAEAGIRDPAGVVAGFQALAAAAAFPHSPGRVRNLLANLAPGLLEQASAGDVPGRLLLRLDSFAESLGARGDLFLSLAENGQLARRLFRLLALSEFLAARLIRHPELFDSLAFPGLPEPPAGPLSELAADDPALLDRLRGARIRQEFKVGSALLLDGAFDGATTALSAIAEASLALACRRALLDHPELNAEPFAVVGLGKLGGREMTLRSDLDLVVVCDDSRSAVDPATLRPLVASLRHTLHSYTRLGRAYEVDMRLRPEGRKGLEVVSLSRLRDYFQERADGWERLAWRKRRVVYSNHWEVEAASLITLPPFPDEELAALRHLRERKELELAREDAGHFDLKNGLGGLLDIHFVTGVCGARCGLEQPSTATVLENLPDDVLKADDRRRLLESFGFLTRLELALELTDEQAGDRIDARPEANRTPADVLGFESGQELLERYRAVTASNREIYETVFENGSADR